MALYLLHIALYAREVTDNHGNPCYHWAFNLSKQPKTPGPTILEASLKYDVTNAPLPSTGDTSWRFRKVPLNEEDSGVIPLIFVTIAELEDPLMLEKAFGTVPIPQGASESEFNCNIWVRDAYAAAAHARGCLRRKVTTGWLAIERQALAYVALKHASGKLVGYPGSRAGPAIWSMLERKEIAP